MTKRKIRTAVVTGGNQGIGLAITNSLRSQGHRVVVASRSVESMLQSDQPDAVLSLPLDVSSSESVAGFYTELGAVTETIDILVNCAGVSVHHKVRGHSDADWLRVMDVNLTGPFRMIRGCLDGMMSQGWGRIVNIASTAATSAQASHAAYCASKSGLLGLSRAVALEGAANGVTCVSVSPTWVETAMLRNSAGLIAERESKTPAQVMNDLAKANPQQRLVQSEEIGELVAFLCSDAAAGLTMEDIQVNAGAHW